MRKNVMIIIVLAMLITVSSAADYCSVKSCGDRHTACLYPRAGPSARCTGHQGSGLKDDEKKTILDLHNQLRQKVARGEEKQGRPGGQPKAKHMANLEWDNEIALVAQRWADQCTWGHDMCRNVDRFAVGQNIAVEGTTDKVDTIKVESMVRMWYDEVKDFDRSQVSQFTSDGSGGRMVGHYTQMVWAKTTKIGCGAVKYNNGRFNRFYLVCNYGPTGNYLGEPLYEIA